MDHQELLKKYISDAISASERALFRKWLDTLSEEEYEALLLQHEALMTAASVHRQEDPAWLDNIFQVIGDQEVTPEMPVRSISRSRPYWRWGAAASILLVLGTGAYFALLRGKAGAGKDISVRPPISDVPAPVGARTILRLADGSEIVVDSVQTGRIASQGSTYIAKNEAGELMYKSGSDSISDGQINTLSTAKGGKTTVVLADGTRVWLNAMSSLKYPAAFTGPERSVVVTGEAYFEVHSDKQKPFIVKTNDTTEIEVLGTQFNINAYPDESAVRTSLFEGAVRVRGYKGSLSAGAARRGSGILMKPGEQATVIRKAANGNREIILVKLSEEDLTVAKAWKEGRFQFNGANLYSVFRQAARWYDLDVTFRDSIADSFSGEISRDVPLSELLNILSATDKIKFEIHEHHLIVQRK
jgi:ferric-dicitrate binding protein FerR (iron transport regulator)